MSKKYKFFNHRECEYFPCHTVKDDTKFNCLFCYCPLYFIKECGGNYSYVNDIEDGIKNCTNCRIPHSENGYDYIVNKIMEKNKEKVEGK